MHIVTSPSSQRTMRTRSDEESRGSMKSISVALPVAVSNVVSRISVSGR